MKRMLKLGIALLPLILLLAVNAFATTGSKSITIDYSNIIIVLDDKAFIPKDVSGNTVEPFIYNGTTFLPVRAVAEAFDKSVAWDEAHNAVLITSPTIQPPSSFSVGIGNYIVGEDISAGKYDVKAISGYGNFQGDVTSLGGLYCLNEILSAEINDYGYGSTYSNLRLSKGDNITIGNNLVLQFTAK